MLAKVPFWWVVRQHREAKRGRRRYLTPDGLWSGKQRKARPFLDYRKARDVAEEEQDCQVVRVWASLPTPKLPSWVKPAALGEREFVVWVRDGNAWAEWHFEPSLEGHGIRFLRFRTHHVAEIAPWAWGPFLPPDIWMEASLRAAFLLRAEKRTKTGGK